MLGSRRGEGERRRNLPGAVLLSLWDVVRAAELGALGRLELRGCWGGLGVGRVLG